MRTGTGGLGFGATVRLTLALLRRDAAALLGLAVLLLLAPRALGGAAAALADPLDGQPIAALLLPVAYWVIAVLYKGGAVHAALEGRGGRRDFAACLAFGLRTFPSNLGVEALVYALVALASLLLVVPGVMLQCSWVAALPANVLKRTGVRDALARSRDLTQGRRWPVFWLILFYAAADGVFAGIGGLAGAPGGPVQAAVLALVESAFAMIGAAGSAAIYLQLLDEGAGLSPGLVEAFE